MSIHLVKYNPNRLTQEQKDRTARDAIGRVVAELEWCDEPGQPGYWMMTFQDGSEICLRLMVEFEP